MGWDKKFDAAMAEAKRDGVHAEDAARMWQKYNELGDMVRSGAATDGAAKMAFQEFCYVLARLRSFPGNDGRK